VELKTEDARNRVTYFCVTLVEAEPAQLGRSIYFRLMPHSLILLSKVL
jgi:hypothetical protein